MSTLSVLTFTIQSHCIVYLLYIKMIRRFRCGKGHEWKATPGSPVCFSCPMCSSKKISGRRRSKNTSKKELREKLVDYADIRRGKFDQHSMHKKIALIYEPLFPSIILLHDFPLFVIQRVGKITSPLQRVTNYKSTVSITCEKDHKWEAIVGNLLFLQTW